MKIDKHQQAQQDREREIIKLEAEMRRIQAQPGSERLVDHYAQRIQKLRDRNIRGTLHAGMTSAPEGHNPRLWPVATGGW